MFSGVPECWLIVPEGNAKTTLIAGLALYHIQFYPRSPSVPVAASSRDQAEKVFGQADGFIARGDLWQFKSLEGYRRIRHDANHGRIQVMAADDRTGDGAIPTLAILDELHRHRDLRLYRTWRGKLTKRGGQIIAISTRGEPGTEFELTLEKIRTEAPEITRTETFTRAASSRLVLHEWAVPADGDVEDIALVKRANPLAAITEADLAEKFATPTMTLGHWRRFVCNRPTRAENAAITEAEWARAHTTDAIPKGVPVAVGLDVAWKLDTTAAVPLWVRDPEYRLFGPAEILVPARDGTSLDAVLIEAALRRIHERNPIETLVMDTSRAEQLGQWAGHEFGCEVIEITQTIPNEITWYDHFMEALRAGWLHHAGDPGLTSHALNAVAKILPRGDAIFERRSQSRNAAEQDRRVIDALIAAAMVNDYTWPKPLEADEFAWG